MSPCSMNDFSNFVLRRKMPKKVLLQSGYWMKNNIKSTDNPPTTIDTKLVTMETSTLGESDRVTYGENLMNSDKRVTPMNFCHSVFIVKDKLCCVGNKNWESEQGRWWEPMPMAGWYIKLGGGGGVSGSVLALNSLMNNGYSAILLLHFVWIILIYCKYCNLFSNFVSYHVNHL